MSSRGKRNQSLRWTGRIVISLSIILFLLNLALVPLVYAQSLEPQQVLLINSYHAGLSWTDNIVKGLEETLAENGPPVELYIEYMDTKRLSPSENYYRNLFELYAYKYQDRDFDLILVSDNNAFNFITTYHEQLFPEVPVVFCGLNFFEPSMLAGNELITGVVEEVDIRANLDLMLSLHPQTEEIVIINDKTTTGLVYDSLLQEVLSDYFDQVYFKFFNNPDAAELPQQLASLSENSLIFLILLNKDKQDRFFTFEQSIELIRQNSTVPIYGLWDFYMDYGLLGGKLANAYAQGENAANLGRQVLEGTPVSELPVISESPNNYIFDYREMERFDLSPADIPEESQIRNRTTYDFEQYRNIIIVVGVVLLILVAALVVQLINARRQQKIEEELRVTNAELEKASTRLEDRVMERTRDLALRSQQLEAVTLVTRAVTQRRDVDELLAITVQRISEHFGFYHAGIFLTDKMGKFAILQAASSPGGQRMLERGHRLARGVGIVGSVLATGKPRIALDVGEDAVWFDNPDLPETHSEVGLPLMVHSNIIGVLDVQSVEENAFDEQGISVLQSMADQVAMAINNARLFSESQRALTEMRRLHGEETRALWEERLMDQLLAYRYSGVEVEKLATLNSEDSQLCTAAHCLQVEIPWREQKLASLSLERGAGERAWHPDEVALVEAVATQAGLALENSRLIEESERQAAYEQQVGEITARIRSQVEIEGILEQAVKELGRALDAEQGTARLSLTAMTEEDVDGS